MKTQVSLVIHQPQMLGLRRVSAMLPVAIALLLTGCPATPTSTPTSETGHASSHSASPAQLTRSEPPSAPTGGRNQSSTSLTTATKNTTDDQAAVRQAVLDDPSLDASLRREFERVPGRSPELLHPLQVGAIAIVENYALAGVSGGVGDLPVIDGYYLLKKQSGQWIVVDPAGWGPGPVIGENWLLTGLGVPKDVVSQLIDTLRTAGNEIEIDDTPYADISMPCTTQIDDPNPPTNVRLAPTVASGNVIGQLPNGAEVRVMEPLNGWLKIRQPLVGWVSMNLTRVSCGDSLAEVQKNLDTLSSLEEELSVEAADTLVRYLHRGAEGAFAEAAIAHFNKFAINRFYALEGALDEHTEAVRRQVLQQVIAAGMHPQARESFEQAIEQQEILSPTLKTWQTLNQN
ncbi:hypothetical protein [Thermoleptolyngbya sp.]